MIICFRTTKTLINFTVEKKSKKMETRYISPEKFSKVSKGKKVIHYPNEWIKDVNGIRYHIVNPNMEYKISELEQKSYPWYLGMTFDDYSKTVKEMFGDDDARVFVLECDCSRQSLSPASIMADTETHHRSRARRDGFAPLAP